MLGNVLGSEGSLVAEKDIQPSDSSKSSEEARETGSLLRCTISVILYETECYEPT